MASPSGMSLEQFTTLLNATDPDFTPQQLAVTLNYRKYEVTNRILPQYKKPGSGQSYQTHIQLLDATNGGHTGMFFGTDQTNLFETDQTVTSQYRHYINSCAYDKAQLAINKGDRVQRYNYLKSQRMAMHRKIADDMKETFWSAPASATDTTSPIGPFGWLTLGTDGDTGSFSGGDPKYLDGNTYSAGGLATATYPKWKSYYADHNGNLNSSLLDIVGRASRKCSFEVPVVPNAQGVTGATTGDVLGKCMVYTSDAVITAIEKIATNSDDRIGYDIAKYLGQTTVKGIIWQYNEVFDTASTYLYGTDPIVAINWDKMYPVVVPGWYFVSTVKDNPFSHNAVNEYVDLFWAGVHCEDRRGCGFLISQQ